METCYTPFFCQIEVMPGSQANIFYLLARMLFNINHYAMTSNILNKHLLRQLSGFPGDAVVENLPANAGDTGSSPGLGRSHMPRSN